MLNSYPVACPHPGCDWHGNLVPSHLRGQADGRGLLVGFGQSDALAEAPLRFLQDPAFRTQTRRRAYEDARLMFWPNGGWQYRDVFTRIGKARQERMERLYRGGVGAPIANGGPEK